MKRFTLIFALLAFCSVMFASGNPAADPVTSSIHEMYLDAYDNVQVVYTVKAVQLENFEQIQSEYIQSCTYDRYLATELYLSKYRYGLQNSTDIYIENQANSGAVTGKHSNYPLVRLLYI